MAGVINYKYPVVGTVAPTSVQMQGINMVIAQIVFTDLDTGAVLVHNMGASFQAGYAGGAFPPASFNSTLLPKIESITNTAPTSTTYNPALTPVFAQTDSNTVTISKPAYVGSLQTITVYLERPTTLDM